MYIHRLRRWIYKTEYILDASLVIKWFIPEIHSKKSVLLQKYSASELFAPDFIQIECANILIKKVRRKEIQQSLADQIQATLLQMPVQLYSWQNLMVDAISVAHLTYRSIYDCLYLVLAKQLEGEMVTADKKLYFALKNSKEWGRYLMWIEDLK